MLRVRHRRVHLHSEVGEPLEAGELCLRPLERRHERARVRRFGSRNAVGGKPVAHEDLAAVAVRLALCREYRDNANVARCEQDVGHAIPRVRKRGRGVLDVDVHKQIVEGLPQNGDVARRRPSNVGSVVWTRRPDTRLRVQRLHVHHRSHDVADGPAGVPVLNLSEEAIKLRVVAVSGVLVVGHLAPRCRRRSGDAFHPQDPVQCPGAHNEGPQQPCFAGQYGTQVVQRDRVESQLVQGAEKQVFACRVTEDERHGLEDGVGAVRGAASGVAPQREVCTPALGHRRGLQQLHLLRVKRRERVPRVAPLVVRDVHVGCPALLRELDGRAHRRRVGRRVVQEAEAFGRVSCQPRRPHPAAL